MSPLFRITLAVAFAGSVAGCATPSSTPAALDTSAPTTLIAVERAKEAVAVGRSTKGDVLAALGETLAVGFDSGFEIWVYRLAERASATAARARGMTRTGPEKPARDTGAEFVILFAPSGVVAKTRVRPAPHGAHEG